MENFHDILRGLFVANWEKIHEIGRKMGFYQNIGRVLLKLVENEQQLKKLLEKIILIIWKCVSNLSNIVKLRIY